ncbi:MAG: cupin domain-containing protein [Acidobacteriaceae bacterium]
MPQIKIVKSFSFATPWPGRKQAWTTRHALRVAYRLSLVVALSGGAPQMKAVSTSSAEHYTWRGAIDEQMCDGWHLHRSETLSIIEERMPPGTAEKRHLHQHATQFFYVLAGELVIEQDGESLMLIPGTGLTVPAQTPHQVFNQSSQDARFLVISQPPSHGDRVLRE